MNSRKTALAVERLEDRCVLAGNVTSGVVAGVLTVAGDGQDNGISLIQTGPGTVEVRGDPGTTVNGGTAAFVASGFQNVDINLKAGNDSAALALVVPGDLHVHLGQGDDVLTFGGFFDPPTGLNLPDPSISVDVQGSLAIEANDGADFVGLFDSRVAGTGTILMGGGDDNLLAVNTILLGNTLFRSGDGIESVTIDTCSFGGTTAVEGGAGDDNVSVFNSNFTGDVTLRGGLGLDTLSNAGNTFNGALDVRGFETVL